MVDFKHIERFVNENRGVAPFPGGTNEKVLEKARGLGGEKGLIKSGEVEQLLGIANADLLTGLITTDADYKKIAKESAARNGIPELPIFQ